MRRPDRILLIFLFLGLITAAASPVNAWSELEAGLEVDRFDTRTRKAAADGDLVILRADPKLWELTLLSIPEPAADGEDKADPPGRNVREWCENFELTAAINAGMFQADRRTHVGFCKVDGRVVNGFANDYLSAAAFGPVDPADPSFRIFDLDVTPLEEIKALYANVVQNLRLIKRPGENRWQPKDDRWRESALGEDTQGRILMIYCDSVVSMHEFNEILLALPIELVCAQHLEGRNQARFWISHPGLARHMGTGFPGPDLPNVLGLTRVSTP